MSTKKISNNHKTLEELRRAKGKTCWAKLIAEEKISQKNPADQKTRG